MRQRNSRDKKISSLYYRIIFYVVLFNLLTPRASESCSVLARHPTKFDSLEYVFIGEVVDFVGPLQAPKIRGYSWGLLVQLKEAVYLPKVPRKYFELFTFSLGADCSAGGMSKEVLEKSYLGSEIRVIAKEAKLFESQLENGNIRLEAWTMNGGSISINIDHEELHTSAKSVFNYKLYTERLKRYNKDGPLVLYDKIQTQREDLFYIWQSFVGLRDFELRKDLLRLKSSNSEKKNTKILKRLIYYPHSNPKGFISVLTKQFLKDEKVIHKLIESTPKGKF